jgi:aquaporin Z
MKENDLKALVAEFVGTFLLAASVLFTLSNQFPVATPLIAGLVLLVSVYAIGPISGSHINPAVTFGLYIFKKVDFAKAISYIGVQLLAGYFAMLLGGALLDAPINLTIENTWPVALSEILGTAVLGFGVASVVSGKVKEELSGVVIGLSLLIGLSLAAASNAVLNPAVALGVSSFSVVYAIAPLVGSTLGMGVAEWLNSGKKSKK